jgi:hypothetical protein
VQGWGVQHVVRDKGVLCTFLDFDRDFFCQLWNSAGVLVQRKPLRANNRPSVSFVHLDFCTGFHVFDRVSFPHKNPITRRYNR